LTAGRLALAILRLGLFTVCGNMAKKKLDLLRLTSGGMAEHGAGPSQIMRCQLVDANFHSFTGTAPAIKALAKTLGVLSFTPLTMLQACAQAVDFKVGHHFGEGQLRDAESHV
jgi:hypothetical protein